MCSFRDDHKGFLHGLLWMSCCTAYSYSVSVHSASFCPEHSPLFKKLSTRPHIWREACRGGTHYYLVKWRVSPSILIWAVRPKFSVIIKSGIICFEKAAYLTAADQTPFFDWLLFDKSLRPLRGFRVKRRTDWFNAQTCFSSEAQKAIHSHLLSVCSLCTKWMSALFTLKGMSNNLTHLCVLTGFGEL